MRSKRLKMVFTGWLSGVTCTALLLILSEESKSSLLPISPARPLGFYEPLSTEKKSQSLRPPIQRFSNASIIHSDGNDKNNFLGAPQSQEDQHYENLVDRNHLDNVYKIVEMMIHSRNLPRRNASFREIYPGIIFKEEEFNLDRFRLPLPRTEPRSGRQVRNLDPSVPRILPLKRPRNVSRSESPHYPWGSHVFGPLHAYTRSPLGTKWNAYFYDQTIAVVLEDSERNLLNCTLLEVIPEHEQRAALRSLGQVMALVPLTFRQMVQLSYYCKTTRELLMPQSSSKRAIADQPFSPDQFWRHAASLLSGILPGTTWCGMGDKARVYSDLGDRRELDMCCRGHDHCPVKLRASATRYGITNTAFSTVSHCLCDEAFRICLEKAAAYDEMASVVGELFFNIVPPQCLAGPKPRSSIPKSGSTTFAEVRLPPIHEADREVYKPRLNCLAIDSQNGCRMWAYNPKHIPLKLRIITPNFQFKAPER